MSRHMRKQGLNVFIEAQGLMIPENDKPTSFWSS